MLPHGYAKHSREQYEKLSTMHKNMQKLYESLGSYYAYDPHAICVEDFFGHLANFRSLFMVSPCPATPVFSSLFLTSFFLLLSLSVARSLLLTVSLSLFIYPGLFLTDYTVFSLKGSNVKGVTLQFHQVLWMFIECRCCVP